MAISDFNLSKAIDVTSATGTPTIECTLCFKITSGDDSTIGTGDIVLDWSNISSQADIAVFDENDNLLDYYFESFDATNKTALIWVYKEWVRDGSTQAKIAYGNGPSDQSIDAVTVFSNEAYLSLGFLFDETSGDAQDVSGNGYDGTLNGGVTQNVSGIIGGAYSFDGTGSVDTNWDGEGWYTYRTIIAWIRTTSDGAILGYGNNYYGEEWRFHIQNDVAELTVREESGTPTYGSTIVTDGEWHLVAAVHDASSDLSGVEIFVDAVNDTDTYGSQDINTTLTYDVAIGRTSVGDQDYFTGDLALITFHWQQLSVDRISAIFEATKSSPNFFSQQESLLVDVVETNSATNITGSSATLNGMLTNIGESDLDVYFEYGTSTSYGSSTPTQTLSSETSFSFDVIELTAFTTYHYRAVATDEIHTWYGNDVSFYTTDLQDVDETQGEFQEGTLTDVVADSSNYLRLVGTTQTTTEGFEGTFPPDNFSTSGDADWFKQSSVVHSGSYAAQAGDITHDQITTLSYTVQYDGKLSFWWKVSSESSFDFLRWYINGTQQNEISGVTNWQQVTDISVVAGDVIEWSYEKDGSISENDDTGWVDDVVLEDISYADSGNRVVQLDLSSLEAYSDSLIEWTSTEPTDTSINLETRHSFDGGSSWSSWQTCTNGSAVPGLSEGDSLSNALLECRETLSTSDLKITPELDRRVINITEKQDPSVTIQIPLEYSATKLFTHLYSPVEIQISTSRSGFINQRPFTSFFNDVPVGLSTTKAFDPTSPVVVVSLGLSGTETPRIKTAPRIVVLSTNKSGVLEYDPVYYSYIDVLTSENGNINYDPIKSTNVDLEIGLSGRISGSLFYVTFPGTLPIGKSGFKSNIPIAQANPLVPLEIQAFYHPSISRVIKWIQNLCAAIRTPLGDQDLHNLFTSFGHLFEAMYLNSFSTELQNLQVTINEFIRGNESKDSEVLVNGLVTEIRNVLNSMNLLSGSTDEITKVINALQDPRSESVLSLLNSYEKGVMDFVRLLNHLSGTSVYPDVDYRIYIDGMSVRDKLTSTSISISQNNVHNSITMSSFDENLYHNLDIYNDSLWGTARIEVQIGSSSTGTFLPSRILYFMMESVEGSEKSYDIWGRSMSAKVDMPYADPIQNYNLDEDKSISDVANEIVVASGANIVVDWNTIDWVINKSWSFSEGVALDGLQKLASIGNFVTRSDDDGNIIVRDKNKVRPCNLSIATPDVNYDRMWNLMSLDYGINRGNRITEVNVDGYGDPLFLPMIEVEELPEDDDTREIGQTSYVRVFWGGNKITDEDDFGVVVTDGEYDLIQKDVVEEKQEVIHFTQSDRKAEVSYPIDGNSATITWYGNDGGDIYYDSGGQEITCDAVYAVGMITYNTRFDRYKLYNHNVKELIFALWARDAGAISVLVKLDVDAPDRPANNSISNDNITTESVAVYIGARWLDDNYYDKKIVSFEAPYNEKAVDGVIAYVNDVNIGLEGNCIIRRADINFEGPKVTNEIEAIQWTS